MSKRVSAFLGLAVAIVFVGAACSDAGRSLAPTAPAALQQTKSPAVANGLLGGLLDGVVGVLKTLLVPPVRRNTQLADDVTWSFTAGPNGAVSSNNGVGLTIVIPPYALSSTRTITVTALKGYPVAYKFEPHGLVFNRKVSLTQDLRSTNAGGLLGLGGLLGGVLGGGSSLQGAYFSTDRLEMSGDLAKVNELLPGITLSNTVTFPIQHFSGYIVASGRDGDSGME